MDKEKKDRGNNLIEGKEYNFTIQNKISLPDDDNYYVLLDPFGKKHLLPLIYYSDYNLKIGTSISCNVDKINCTGRIFLEPKHPFYIAGEIYEFDFLFVDKILDKEEKSTWVAVFKDVFGKKVYAPVLNHQMDINFSASKLKCKVEKLKKGKPYLVQLT